MNDYIRVVGTEHGARGSTIIQPRKTRENIDIISLLVAFNYYLSSVAIYYQIGRKYHIIKMLNARTFNTNEKFKGFSQIVMEYLRTV